MKEKISLVQIYWIAILNLHVLRLIGMLNTPTINSYTIEKSGIKKMIHQTPYYTNGVFSGVIEISFEIPKELPHFNRD